MAAVRASFQLLRRYPRLWVPQLIAALVNLFVNTFALWLVHQLPELVRPWEASALAGPPVRARATEFSTAVAHSLAMAVYCASYLVETGACVLAIAATAGLVWRIVSRQRASTPAAPAVSLGGFLQLRCRAIVNATFLLVGLYMLDVLAQNLYPTAFAFVPWLNAAPAWLLIPLSLSTDLLLLLVAYYAAIPFVAAVALPPGCNDLNAAQYAAARHVTVPFILAWNVFQLLWGLVEARFIPRDVDPGPVWRAPVTVGHPAFNFFVLVMLSVLYALIAQRPATDDPY